MKLTTALAGAVVLGLCAAAPAAAQDRHDPNWQGGRHDQTMSGDRDRHDEGMRGDRDRHDMDRDRHDMDRDRHDMDRDRHMDRHDWGRHEGWRDHYDRGHHYGWRNHHRNCRMVWRHHRQMRVCGW